MVASKIAELGNTDLDYLERLLLNEFTKETEILKTWRNLSSPKPGGKQNQILSCLQAVRSQKQLKATLDTKW